MNEIRIFLLSLVIVLTLNSCANSSVSSAQTLLSSKNNCVITSSIAKAQKKDIQKYAQIKYGGFANGPWGATGVINLVIISVNEKYGNERYFDSRGSYNNKWNGSYRVESSSGRVTLIVRPDHYQIPRFYNHRITFNATPGHEYFAGAILDEVSPDFRWIPVIYDKTNNKVIELKDQKITKHPKPVTIYL